MAAPRGPVAARPSSDRSIAPAMEAPDGFAQALIQALQAAEDASAAPRPTPQLAQAAWDKLQYDFPVRQGRP